MKPAISLMAMHLEGVGILPFALSVEELKHIRNGTELIQHLDLYPTDSPNFIALADSSSDDMDRFLALVNEGYSQSPLIGGLSSGMIMGSPNWLLLDGQIIREGVVGIALTGAIQFDVIVSQGCRPIGTPYVITKARQNLLYEVAGRPTLEILQETLKKLPPDDQSLARQSLLVGIARNKARPDSKKGDFLIRNILGLDKTRGVLVIGETVKPGQMIQFFLRDAHTSKENLKDLLEKLGRTSEAQNEGAILVSCLGRGKVLYGESHHDVQMIQARYGPIPLSGFFANGEFAPLGGKNYVHGYTSSLTIIR